MQIGVTYLQSKPDLVADYEDVPAYQLSLAEDTVAITQLVCLCFGRKSKSASDYVCMYLVVKVYLMQS